MQAPYISEVDYRGGPSTDFIEVSLPVGTDPSTVQVVVYHNNGNVRSTNDLGSLQDTAAGEDVYLIAGQGVHMHGAIALVVDGDVTQFISFDRAVTARQGPAAGETSTQVGSLGNDTNASLVSTDGGGSYSFEANPTPGVVPCFLSGTLIATPQGAVRIEQLQAGDLIDTVEGAQPLRWIGRSPIKAKTQAVFPVRLPAGCLGPGLPARDLWVSQNHRVALEGFDCELLFGTHRVLVAAKHLVGQAGIGLDHSIARPVYYHMLFDRHELLWSNNLLTESFHPGDVVLSDAQPTLTELQQLFPDLPVTPRVTHSPCLRAHEARVLIGQRIAPT